MGNFLKTQNVFSGGEISSEFYATNNSNGLSKLENVDVLESGGLKRRLGLKKIKEINSGAIIVPFVISESEKYLLVIYNQAIDVYGNDTKITTITAPWATSDLPKLQYAQRFNKIFFVHPDYSPRIFAKTGNSFNISAFSFKINSDASVNIPFMKFDDTDGISISITSSALGNNYATFTTNVNFWNQTSVGERLYVNGQQWVVFSVQDERVATVATNGGYTLPGYAIYDWYESVFNDKRGWPHCVSFHQNRLIFGGTKSAPNCIWMSKVGDYYNFDTGTGLDDEAIYVTLLSAQHHQICTIVSSDKLQILTSVGEWAISNSPLTPSNVDVKQHTNIGSFATRYLPPQKIESNTVFVSGSGKDIRELDLDALSENYSAVDLCAFAKHLINNPISMAYNQDTHQLFVVMNAGYMAVLNRHISQDIAAWATYKTEGDFKYVAVINNTTYVIVNRDGTNILEKFDASCLNDSGEYNFDYTISAFPMIINGHSPKQLRARKISMRVINTKTLFVNGKRIEIPNYVYDDDNPGYCGDLSINLLGSQNDVMKPLWTISSNEQLPATILAVTIDGTYSI